MVDLFSGRTSKIRCDIACFLHIDNYGLIIEGKRYSQILDPLVLDLQGLDLIVKLFRYPLPLFTYIKTLHPHNTLTFRYFCLFIQLLLRGSNLRQTKVLAWVHILQLLRCRLILAIQPGSSLCEASKRLSIPIYDIQHGFISTEDPYYGPWFDDLSEHVTKPDGLLLTLATSYEYWKNQHIYPRRYYIGSPYLMDPLHCSEEIKTVSTDSFTILFSHQSGYGSTWPNETNTINGEWHHSGIPMSLLSSLFYIAHPVRLIIRVHPLSTSLIPEIQQLLRSLSLPTQHSFSVSDPRFEPLPHVLSTVSLHATSHSAVINEAIEYEIPSIVFGESLFMQDQLSHYEPINLVHYCKNDVDELLPLIYRYQKSQQLITPTRNSLHKKRVNYLSRLCNVIYNLL